MHPFRHFIEKYVSLNSTDWLQIEQHIQLANIKKGEIILREGQICRHLYFLEKGLLRYYIQKNGLDITKFFTDAPYTFTSQLSFTQRSAATENIEALEDSIIWSMTLDEANDLLSLPSWSTFIRKLLLEVQGYIEEILTEIQTVTAQERYARFIQNNSSLLIRIPQKHIASYLGIEPQSLSRIRKKMMSKKLT